MSYPCHRFVILLSNVFKSSNLRLDLFKIIFMKTIFTLIVLLTSFLFSPIAQAQCTLNVVSTSNLPCMLVNYGVITVEIQNPVSYNLMPGNINNTTGTFSNLFAGTYTITGTDNSMCTSSTIVTLTQPPPTNITTVSTSNIACYGASSGQIIVTATGGTPPFIYNILPNGGFQSPIGTFNGLPANQYTIIAVDANNCMSSTIGNITQPAPLTVMFNSISSPTCASSCNGSFAANIIGGTQPYTYTISPNIPNNLNTFTNACVGTYTVNIVDANGCTHSNTHNVNPGSFILNTTITSPSCGPSICDGAVLPTTVGGTAPFVYTITGNNFSNLCSGSYTVSVTDANSCYKDTIISLIPSIYNQNMQLGLVVNGSTITSTPSGGTAPYQYSLNNGPFISNNTFSMLCSGTYSLTIKDSYGAGCLKDTVVTVQAATSFAGGSTLPYIVNPSCQLSTDGMISLIVTPSSTYTYQWNNNQTTSYLNNLQVGTYSVQILNPANECVELSIPLNSIGINCGNISGNVYYDSTLNCIQEPFEDIIPGTMIIANPGNHITFTDAFGNYAYNQLPYGTYTLSHQNNINAFQTHCGNSFSAVLSAVSPNQVVNFGDSLKLDLDYALILDNMWCFLVANPNNTRYIYYNHNNPSYPSTGKVYAVFDSISHYVSSNPAHTTISGDTVFWNVTNITNAYQSILINFTFPTTFTAANTFPFTIGLSNLQYSDTNQLNNQINYTIPFCNSYDPNDKHVAPKGEGPNGNILASDLLLTYNINFQNTGNAPAYNIVIEDTLSDKLDITTFNVLQTSHPYQLEVVNNQIIKWKFYNIMLPDSTTNEPASHGQIHYQIRQKNGNQIGDVIKNKAYIYFDYNPPIITNETVNTIYQPTGIKNTTAIRNQVVIYPNPASTEVYIDAEQAFSEITLFNQQLSVIDKQNFVSTKTKKLNISSLNNGIYFIKTITGEMKKLVVQH